MSKDHAFTPAWYEGQLPPRSYRSLFKWGAPNEHKHPNHRLYALLKSALDMHDDDFRQPQPLGLETVDVDIPPRLNTAHLKALTQMVGSENALTDTYARLKASYGKTMVDLLRLRQKTIENIPDIVLRPRQCEDIVSIVRYCDQHRIPLYVFGGGSSVTRGMEAVCGGVTLDMSIHMKRVLAFNESDQTITVEAGMWGPELEATLNQAPERLQAARRYTCGHFPQSFEYSSVGGWIVTRGAGQNSTYYGKIEDIVLAQEYVTPAGSLQTPPWPRHATGADIDQIMIGSEGAFGVLTAATLKVFRFMPHNRRNFSYMFRTWQDGLNACREIMQCEAGFPSVFRLSDPEETEVAMKLYGVEGTAADGLLRRLGYAQMEKCLLLGCTDGERGFARNLAQRVAQICRDYRAFPLSAFNVTQRWEKDRFRDPYLREDLLDYGIIIDTLECAVTWSQAEKVHSAVRAYLKSRPNTICMTHLSHAYPQGSNLYFIFITRLSDMRDYLELLYGILEVIQQNGAAISHHHGIGKQTAPWLEENIGSAQMDVLRALKKHFDPHNIMNPGGTLGLDMTPEQRAKRWGL